MQSMISSMKDVVVSFAQRISDLQGDLEISQNVSYLCFCLPILVQKVSGNYEINSRTFSCNLFQACKHFIYNIVIVT